MTLPDIPPPRGAPRDDSERESWHITDERAAEWVMRKLSRFRARELELTELRAEYQAQLEDWWEDATRGLAGDIKWATGALVEWASRRREEDPEAKSVVLPSGRVATRWIGERARAVDAPALAESLARAHHPDYDKVVRAKIEVDANALNSLVKTSDEWVIHLSCGCRCTVWQLSEAQVAVEGMAWPVRPGEHRQGCIVLSQAESPALTVAGFERGRVGMPVAVIPTERGPRVIPLQGVAITPGHLSVTVTPR